MCGVCQVRDLHRCREGGRGVELATTQSGCAQPPRGSPSTGLTSAAGLKTDLQLARQEITALRSEPDRLNEVLRRQLRQQLEQGAAGDLVAWIDELVRQNQELSAERMS